MGSVEFLSDNANLAQVVCQGVRPPGLRPPQAQGQEQVASLKYPRLFPTIS